MTGEAVIAEANALLGADPVGLVAQKAFTDDVTQLDTTLAIVKYRSQSIGPEMLALQDARRGYDLILQLGDAGANKLVQRNVTLPVQPAPPPAPKEAQLPQTPPKRDFDTEIDKIAQARLVLRDAIRSGDFVQPENPSAAKKPPAVGATAKPIEGRTTPGATRAVIQQRSWRLTSTALKRFPAVVARTIRTNTGDLASTSATALVTRLSDVEANLRKQQALQGLQATKPMVKIGSQLIDPGVFVGWQFGVGNVIGSPGNIRPVGIGDLMIVREHLKAYEGGEVGHI